MKEITQITLAQYERTAGAIRFGLALCKLVGVIVMGILGVLLFEGAFQAVRAGMAGVGSWVKHITAVDSPSAGLHFASLLGVLVLAGGISLLIGRRLSHRLQVAIEDLPVKTQIRLATELLRRETVRSWSRREQTGFREWVGKLEIEAEGRHEKLATCPKALDFVSTRLQQYAEEHPAIKTDVERTRAKCLSTLMPRRFLLPGKLH